MKIVYCYKLFEFELFLTTVKNEHTTNSNDKTYKYLGEIQAEDSETFLNVCFRRASHNGKIIESKVFSMSNEDFESGKDYVDKCVEDLNDNCNGDKYVYMHDVISNVYNFILNTNDEGNMEMIFAKSLYIHDVFELDTHKNSVGTLNLASRLNTFDSPELEICVILFESPTQSFYEYHIPYFNISYHFMNDPDISMFTTEHDRYINQICSDKKIFTATLIERNVLTEDQLSNTIASLKAYVDFNDSASKLFKFTKKEY